MYQKIQTYQRVPQMGTSLPSSPQNGDQFLLVDSMSAPTYQWLLQYVSAKASNKWVFIGGSPGTSEVTTDEGTTSDTYAALATAGPTFAIPVAGDYLVTVGGQSYNGTSGIAGVMSYDIGGTGAVDADAWYGNEIGNGNGGDATRTRKKSGLTAVTLTAKYKRRSASGTTQFKNRWMSVIPVAIGG